MTSIEEYDITAMPRDFTPAMIVELIDSGIMEIPIFQRNFVWDIKRASLLIESLILGLPVPELFLYSEDDENSTYKIIDGQQRILSIYFFAKGRFPKSPQGHLRIREAFNEWGDEQTRSQTLSDDKLFKDFRLEMDGDKKTGPIRESLYNQKTLDELNPEMKIKFRLRRTVRGVVIRQNKPDDSSSSMFEIFSRLNTGGVKLKPQEVRASLFYCEFYKAMVELNEGNQWSVLYGKSTRKSNKVPRGEDIEAILRAFAFYSDSRNYQPSMENFLNKFSKKSMKFSPEEIYSYKKSFLLFLESCSELGDDAFLVPNGKLFLQTLFYAVFTVTCNAISSNPEIKLKICPVSFNALKNNREFSKLYKHVSGSSDVMRKLFRMTEQTVVLNKVGD